MGKGFEAYAAFVQSFRDEEQNKKREQLQRKIEETRKKLQNVSKNNKKNVVLLRRKKLFQELLECISSVMTAEIVSMTRSVPPSDFSVNFSFPYLDQRNLIFYLEVISGL